MSIGAIEQAATDRILYEYVLSRLADVQPFQVARNPESHKFVAVDGASGSVLVDFGTDTEAEAAEAWRKANALMLSEDWAAMLDRLIQAQTLGYVPPDEGDDADSG